AFALVRPTLRHPDAAPTEKTLNRIANLQNVYVEKTSSHAVGMTADQGDEVTFSISIKNSNKTEKTFEITDTVPAGTTYVGGADSVDGNTLKWSVTVPSGGGKKDISYTVKVNADAKDGDKIHSVAKVGGVDVQCRPIYVGGNLNAEEQAKIYDAASKVSGGSATGLALAKQIYASAGIACDIGTETEIMSSIFKTTTRAIGHFELNTSSEYMKILAPTMYGGNMVYTNTNLYDGDRTKGPMLTQLMAGDIVICKEGNTYASYLFVGQNKAMDLNAGKVAILDLIGTRDALFSTLGYNQFVIIRPAMAE
ncbi:MAG: isopeptide-forming domain-containing fimbrial protein, partial [Clostridia bacterium]|nr:isopeptide-forming domain-containing fimbrial protein [Clostridia bacterium]